MTSSSHSVRLAAFLIYTSAALAIKRTPQCERTTERSVEWIGALSIDRIGRVLLDPDTGRIIVGARNRLLEYAFDLSGPLVEKRTDPTKNERDVCSVDYPHALCEDYNQVLLLARNALLACGTGAGHPYCTWRSRSDLEKISEPFSSNKLISVDPDISTSAAIDTNDLSIYTGSQRNNNNNPSIVRRKPDNTYRSTFERDDLLINPHFISAFPFDQWMYFLYREDPAQTKVGNNQNGKISRVARICLDDAGVDADPRKFHSFVKAQIACRKSNTFNFGELVDAVNFIGTWGSDTTSRLRMFAIFSPPKDLAAGAALCVYSYEEDYVSPRLGGEGNMRTVFDGSYFYRDDPNSMWQEKKSDRHFDCLDKRPINEAVRVVLMKETITQITEEPSVFMESERFTSIAIDSVKSVAGLDAVVFVSTERGDVLKFGFRNAKSFLIEKMLISHCEIKQLILNPPKGIFYSVNNSIVRSFPMHTCSRFDTCSDCLKANDPYCGWCTSGESRNHTDSEATCMTRAQCDRRQFNLRYKINYLPSDGVGNGIYCRAADSPPLVKMKDPPNRIVAKDHVTLTCTASGMPPPTLVRWEKDRVPLYPIDFESYGNSLTLRSVTSRTSGHYTCVYKNREGYGSDTKEVYVQTPAKIVQGPQNTKAIKDQIAIFYCHVLGDPLPDIRWQYRCKNKVRLCPLPRGAMSVNDGQMLIITKSNETTEGKYRCSASNDLDTTPPSPWAQLTVLYPPWLKEASRKKEYFVEVGGKVKLYCSAGGSPSPTVTWFHNGKLVPLHVKHLKSWSDLLQDATILPRISNRFHLKKSGHVDISDARFSDEGTWECRGANSAGKSILNRVILKVKRNFREKPDLLVTPTNLTIFDGEKAEFGCKPNGGMDDNATLIWLKRDRNTQLLTEIQEVDGPTTYVTKRNTLLFHSVDKGDRGEYVCQGGGVKKSVYLSVIDDIDDSVYSTKLKFMCAAVPGSKKTPVRFLAAEMTTYYDMFHEQKSLTCATKSNKETTQIKIKNLPIVIESPPAILITSYGSQVILFSEALCDNPSEYKVLWTRNGKEIMEQNSHFTIETTGCRSQLTWIPKRNDNPNENNDYNQSKFICWFRSRDRFGVVSSQAGVVALSNKSPPKKIIFLVAKGDNLTVGCPLEPSGSNSPTWENYTDEVKEIKYLDCNRRAKCSKRDFFRLENVRKKDTEYFYSCWYEEQRKGRVEIKFNKGMPTDTSHYLKANGWDWRWQVAPQN